MLISGQATVLYGASTFSEDIDLWVAPEKDNWQRFIKCLQQLGARVYKLTPPITMKFIDKGHGFHFEFQPTNKTSDLWFLDVMGYPPRVKTFDKEWETAVVMETGWGKIPVSGLRTLVEIKKTRRLEDYTIISNIVRIEYEKLVNLKNITEKDWYWILTNSFEIEDILYYLKTHQPAYHTASNLHRPCLVPGLKFVDTKKEKYFVDASTKIMLEIEQYRNKDRLYWKSIIAELKKLDRNGKLLSPGMTPKFGN